MERKKAFRLSTALSLATLAFGVSAYAANAQVEINFWDQQWGPQSYSDTAQKLVDQYNSSQSDIHVTYRSVPWSNWYETYVTAISSGSAPDVSTGAGFMAVQFYSMDAIQPVDDLVKEMEADGSAADFLPGTMDAMKYDGHYMALPWQIDIRMIYYNKDLLAANNITPPTNWDEFRAAAKALTANGVYGVVAAGDSLGVHWVPTMAINAGGGVFDKDGKAALDSGPALQGLEFLGDLVKDGSVNPASAGYSGDDSRGSFLRGEAAFILDGPGLTSRAADKASMVGILDPLAAPDGHKGALFWVNNVMVYKSSQHVPETMKFLKWWSENQKPLWTDGAGCCIPVRNSFLKDEFFATNPDIVAAVGKYVPVAQPMSAPVGGTFPKLNAVEGDGFLNSLIQQVWQGGDVKAAASEAQAHLEDLLKE